MRSPREQSLDGDGLHVRVQAVADAEPGCVEVMRQTVRRRRRPPVELGQAWPYGPGERQRAAEEALALRVLQ